MQENFENYVFNNDTIKGLYSLDDNELQELCDYLINLFKKEKIVYHGLDIFTKVFAIYTEIEIINNIIHTINNINNLLDRLDILCFLYFLLSICILILNEGCNYIQNIIQFKESIIDHINNKDLKFLNTIINVTENDGNGHITFSLNNEFLDNELKKLNEISNNDFQKIMKKK